MISFKEILNGHSISDIPIAHQQNIDELLKRINIVRAAYGKPMKVTSGYRNLQDMKRIYSNKKFPMHSAHLFGMAVDIADPDGELGKWLHGDGAAILEQADLYCERDTKGWIHFQTRPTSQRWFYA
jgi:hypothetical protein